MNGHSDRTACPKPLVTVTWILRFCIVLGTVVYMAFGAVNTLSFLVSSIDLKPGTFLLEASGKDGNGAANRSELILKAVILDGRRLRWNSAVSKNNWQEVDRGEAYPVLRYGGTSDAASLTFQAKKFVAIFQADNWPGVLRTQRNGRDIETLALRNPGGQDGLIVLESPAAPTSAAIFVVAFMLFGAFACRFGPIHSGRSSLPWLIFSLSMVHFFFWGAQCIGTTNDSPAYVGGVSSFFAEGHPDYFPPGYPALLGLVGSLSGENLGRFVTLIQHGMVVVAAVWIYLVLMRMVSEGAALLGAFLSGALAPSLTLPQIIMSEATTLFAMVGALYFTVRGADTQRYRFLVLAGVFAGWAGTLRIVPLAALLPSMCVICLLRPSPRRLKLAVMTLAVTLAFMALPIAWCSYKSGEPALSNSVGLHLFNRVVMEQQQLDEDGPATKTLTTLLAGRDPRAGYAWWHILELAAVEDGHQFELLLRRVSWEGIRKDPWAFLLYTPYLAWKVLMGDASTWLPYWGDTNEQYPSLENAPLLNFSASSWNWRLSLEQIHKSSWLVLCWLAFAGFFLGLIQSQYSLILALAWVPFGYLLSSASVEYFNPRFNAPIIPFVAALAMIPLGSLMQLFKSNSLVVHQPVPGV